MVRACVSLALAIACICFQAASQEEQIRVTGKLIRVVAIGGESTGWAIYLESQMNVAGKAVDSLEVHFDDVAELKRLENKRVRATGKLTRRQGVETGTRVVLEVASIEEMPASTAAVGGVATNIPYTASR